ncbi:EamA domain-containing protein [Cephalotus follicularis]|uniref:WAT1-related protein n=1 Tax=Cephalotus follicularis TaxID=3775 RepID=A0A1Q3D9N8_CEPFO|nr:EamA domain-containing protein [Cephalotus follicularis]
MFGSAVTAVMIVLEFFDVGLNTISKAAMRRGMSQFVYVVYSNALAIFILLASSFIFYRKRTCSPPTVSIICRIFLLGLIASSVQMLIYTGIQCSSPILASVMIDLTPAFTFILAVMFRMEKLDLRVQSSQARSFGTIVSITGALMVTLYQGPPIISTSSADNLPIGIVLSPQANWVLGGILLATGGFFLSLLYIVQTWIIKQYPEELMVTLICCIFVTIQCAIVSLFAERDPNAWIPKPDMGLIAIVYSAIFSVTFRSVVHTWACRKKGPVYACMFKPLGIVIAVIMGVSFLGDTLCLGR